MNSKILAMVAVVIVAAAAVGGTVICSSNNDSDDDTLSVKDMLGVEVDVTKNPEHVACVSRTTYDLLVAFGLGDRIDGVYYTLLDNEWTSVLYPESSEHYAYPYQPSYELLLERNVDLVLAPEAYISDGLREHGIAAMTVCLYGNPDFEPYVFYLAELAKTLWPDVEGVKEKANQWEKGFQDVIDEVTSTLASKEYEEKTVYYVRGDKDKGICYTDTGCSFNEYIFDLLGMNFLGKSFETNKPSTEALLAADPDVIVIGGIYQHKLYSTLTSDSTWENMSAVKDGKVYGIGVGFSPMEQLGVFSSVFLADMANCLYPDDFSFDTVGMLKSLCSTYFGVDLTDEQAGYMLDGYGPTGERMA